jgi:hypothetical protein
VGAPTFRPIFTPSDDPPSATGCPSHAAAVSCVWIIAPFTGWSECSARGLPRGAEPEQKQLVLQAGAANNRITALRTPCTCPPARISPSSPSGSSLKSQHHGYSCRARPTPRPTQATYRYVGCARPNRARADPATTSSLLAGTFPFVSLSLSFPAPPQPWICTSCARAARACRPAACSTSPSFRPLATTPLQSAQSRPASCRSTIPWGRKYGSSTHGRKHSCPTQSACPT